MQPGAFEVLATDGAARAATLHTAHGPIETPAFMPVGTKASVKAMDPAELVDLGTQVVLGNAYHLHFRPGEDVIAELGGLHAFMGWGGPILTDSGGFQVFSLLDTAKIDAEGVTFRSVYDGALARFTPELAMEIQRTLGSDIAMCFDECPPGGAERKAVVAAVDRTLRWAERCHATEPAPGQLRFGIVQGGVDLGLRRDCADALTAIPFDGYAIGGLSVGEERSVMFHVTEQTAPHLPAARPRYFMGIGDPEAILRVIAAGIDMFDCVLPTRLGRTGSAFTWEGRLNLRNARFTRDPGPLDAACTCSTCSRFSRAYLRHLVTQNEVLALRLLTVHNLSFLLNLTRDARDAIRTGTFAAFLDASLARLASD
jgi:queuine tRNA-ribosyltransferase